MGWRDRLFAQPSRPGVAITAAAKLIEPGDDTERTRIRSGPKDWQKQAWQFFDDLEAISYPARYVSGAIGRLRLGAAMRPDPREQPVLLDPDGKDDLDLKDEERDALNATIERLGSGEQPIGELQRLLSLNLFLTGDGYLIGYDSPGTGEELWDVVSVEELVLAADGRGYARRRTPEGGAVSTETLPESAFICRIYQRHARYSALADSSMRAVLELCDELKMLTDSIRASASSRIPAGVMFLTHGMMGSPPDQTQIGQPDEAQNNPTIQRTIEHFETPIKNRKSASAVVPLMLIGEPDDIKAAHVWEPTRHIDETAAAQRAEIINRIAIGLDIPGEILTGKADLNHWTAWQVNEETFKFHLEPDAQTMVNALTTGFFRPHLAKMGVTDLNRFFVWYDATDLISHPNRGEDYQKAYDAMEVSGRAYLRAKNIPDVDAIDDEERAERLRRQILSQSRVQLAGLPTEEEISGDEPIETAVPSLPGAPMRPEPEPTPASPETVQPGPAKTTPPARQAAAVDLPPMATLAASAAVGPVGPRLAQIERSLRLRLLQAADDEMRRALERAGNRLRSLANKGGAQLRALVAKKDEHGNFELDAIDVASVLGPERVAQLETSAEDLTAGAFDKLYPRWTTWTTRAQEQAIEAIDEHGDLDEVDAAMLTQKQTTDRENGWAVLRNGLIALAALQLFAPHAPAPVKGEWTDFSVPPGLIRDALVTAGGGPDGETTAGIMSGTTVHEAIDAAGLTITSYTWQHGDPARPFEPHEALDGTVFYSADDEVLANNGGFPDAAFYSVGDHDGCLCEIVEAVESLADTEPAT